jgi:hypothetical protein
LQKLHPLCQASAEQKEVSFYPFCFITTIVMLSSTSAVGQTLPSLISNWLMFSFGFASRSLASLFHMVASDSGKITKTSFL